MNLDFRSFLCALALTLGLAACGNLGAPVPRSDLYDLGTPSPLDPPPVAVPARIETVAPGWLQNPDMQYRLDYRQPARRESYSESRWVAPPAEMVGHALDRVLTGNGVAAGECRLRVNLDEFVQVFDDPRSSHALLVARATLLPARTDAPLARQTFVIREPAPTPDAEGGVIAHRRAVDQLGRELAGWVAALDRDGGQGLNTNGRCRR